LTPELTWTITLAWFAVIVGGLTVGGLVTALVASWLWRRG
jgi:hypothetical protein